MATSPFPSPPSSGRRWYERTLTAVAVFVGFAAGSIGLSVLAQIAAEEPVLTDEFRLVEGDDGTLTAIAVTTTTTTSAPVSPVTSAEPVLESDIDLPEDDERRRSRDGRRDRDGRPPQT